jgi:hypothetical protein
MLQWWLEPSEQLLKETQNGKGGGNNLSEGTIYM